MKLAASLNQLRIARCPDRCVYIPVTLALEESEYPCADPAPVRFGPNRVPAASSGPLDRGLASARGASGPRPGSRPAGSRRQCPSATVAMAEPRWAPRRGDMVRYPGYTPLTAAGARSVTAAGGGSRMTVEVFVVDDEPEVVSVLREVVESAGFVVSTFGRVEEAVGMLAERQPAVLVTDLRMPGPSGLELVRKARAMSPDTQVVILTGYGDLDSAVQALRLGAFDYLAKPVDAERLVQTVRNGVERRRLVLENRRLVRCLSESNLLKTEFINGISHEVRTPLGQILGYAQLLRGTALGLSDKQHRYLQSIQEAATRVLDLFENILQFSTLQSGDGSLTSVEVSLPALLDEVRQIHHEAAERRGVRVEVAASDSDRTVMADLDICRKVLSLLLDNAIKFTPEGGRVVLSGEVRGGLPAEHTAMPLPAEVRADRWLHLAVADSGPGVADEDRQRIFNLFEQGDASLTRSHEGTGLGLALALSLARLHGGTIALASRPHAGSTFTLVIPL